MASESPLERRDTKSSLDERQLEAESFLLALDAASRYADIRAQTHEVLGHRLRSRLARRDGARIRRLIVQRGIDDDVARGQEVVADLGEVHEAALDDAELSGLTGLPTDQGEPVVVPEGGGSGPGDAEVSGPELGAGMLVPVVVEPEIAVASRSESDDADPMGLEDSASDDPTFAAEPDFSAIPEGDGDREDMEEDDFELEAGYPGSVVEGLRPEEERLVEQLGFEAFLLAGDDSGVDRDTASGAVLEAETPEPLLVEPLDVSTVEELRVLDEFDASAFLEGDDGRRGGEEGDAFDLGSESGDALGFEPEAVQPLSESHRLDPSTAEDVVVLGEIDAVFSPLEGDDSGQGAEEDADVDPDAELLDSRGFEHELVEPSLSGSLRVDERAEEDSAATGTPLLAEVGASSLPLEGTDSGRGVEKGRDVELEPEGSGMLVVGSGAVESPVTESLTRDETVAPGSAAADSPLGDVGGPGAPVEGDDWGSGVEERGGVELDAEVAEPLTAGGGPVESPSSESLTLDEPVAEALVQTDSPLADIGGPDSPVQDVDSGRGVEFDAEASAPRSWATADSPLADVVGPAAPPERDDSGRGVEERSGVEFDAEVSEALSAGPGAVESPLSESATLDEQAAEGSPAADSLLGDVDALGASIERDDSGRDVEELGALEFEVRSSGRSDVGRETIESVASVPETPEDRSPERSNVDDAHLFDWLDIYTRPLEPDAGEGGPTQGAITQPPFGDQEPVEAPTSSPETLGVPGAEDSLLLDEIAVYTFPLEGGNPGYGGVQLDAEVSENLGSGPEAVDSPPSEVETVDVTASQAVLPSEYSDASPSLRERENPPSGSEPDTVGPEAEAPQVEVLRASISEGLSRDPDVPAPPMDQASPETSQAERSGLLDLIVAYTQPIESGGVAAPGEEGRGREAKNLGPSTVADAETPDAVDSEAPRRTSAYKFPFRSHAAPPSDARAPGVEQAQVDESRDVTPGIAESPASGVSPPSAPAGSGLLARLRAYAAPREPADPGLTSPEGVGSEPGVETASPFRDPAVESPADDDAILLGRLGAYTLSSDGPLSTTDSERDGGGEIASGIPEPPLVEAPSTASPILESETREDRSSADSRVPDDVGASPRDEEDGAANPDAEIPAGGDIESPGAESTGPDIEALDAEAAEISAEAKTLLLERISAYTFHSGPGARGERER